MTHLLTNFARSRYTQFVHVLSENNQVNNINQSTSLTIGLDRADVLLNRILNFRSHFFNCDKLRIVNAFFKIYTLRSSYFLLP